MKLSTCNGLKLLCEKVLCLYTWPVFCISAVWKLELFPNDHAAWMKAWNGHCQAEILHAYILHKPAVGCLQHSESSLLCMFICHRHTFVVFHAVNPLYARAHVLHVRACWHSFSQAWLHAICQYLYVAQPCKIHLELPPCGLAVTSIDLVQCT